MKTRMSVLDCRRMVNDLKEKVVGMYLHNIYDLNPKTFQLKLSLPGKDKVQLLIEAGTRFHTTQFARPKSDMPSGFAIKLRKHLRDRKLSGIRQIGFDRVVVFTFGFGEFAYHLVVELYASGNIALTDGQYVVLSSLRTFSFDEDSKVAVRTKYPFEAASSDIAVLSSHDVVAGLDELLRQLDEDAQQEPTKKKKKQGTLKQGLMRSNLFKTYGKDLLEHCFIHGKVDARAGFDKQLLLQIKDSSEEVENIVNALNYSKEVIEKELTPQHKGYILAESGDVTRYIGFQPIKLKQYEQDSLIEFEDFDRAVDEYFTKLEAQRDVRQTESIQRVAEKRLEKVKVEQMSRIESLKQSVQAKETAAELLSTNLTLVENAILVVRSALANGMSWDELNELVDVEKSRDNPVAKAIHSLQLETNEITLLLADEEGGKPMRVRVNLSLSAYANITAMYDDKKKAAFKAEKTAATSEKVISLAKQKAEASIRKQNQGRTGIEVGRKVHWFERFNWFVTREGVLVLCGRDAQQNELLVKRYLRASYNDVYVHADLHGAPTCIVRNPKKGSRISQESLKEAGIITVCRSSAWTSKVVTSAWWVNADQVSKTAPTGEYLQTGSFMIRGKKNFLPPCRLELSFGYIFKLDETQPSMKERKREWRLLEDVVKESELDDKLQQAIRKSAVPVQAAVEPPETDNKSVDSEEESKPTTDGQVEDASSEKEDQTIVKQQRLSAHERRQMKKYGEIPGAKKEGGDNSSLHNGKSSEKQVAHKPKKVPRGKRGKLKKMQKYAEQTEEERKLAMAALGNPLPQAASESDNASDNKGSGRENNKEAFDGKKWAREKRAKAAAVAEKLDAEDIEKLNSSELDLQGFTADPKPGDVILYALPMCGPTPSMLHFKYRVKLVPGSSKRSRAAKTALELFCRFPGCNERERSLLRAVSDNVNVQTIVGNLKLSAPGINKATKAVKSSKKKKGKQK